MPFIPIGSPLASLGGALGEGFSKHVNDSLNMLAQQKMYEIQLRAKQAQDLATKSQFAQMLQPAYGKYAQLIAHAPQTLQKALLSNPAAFYQFTGQEPGNFQPQVIPQEMQQDMQQPSAEPPTQDQSFRQPSIAELLNALSGEKLPNLQQRGAEPIPEYNRPAQRPEEEQMYQPEQYRAPLSEQQEMQNAIAQAMLPPMSEYQKQMATATQERLKLSQEKEIARQQEKLQPFLAAETKDVNNMRTIGTIAREMKSILENNRQDFPNRAIGLLPLEVQSYLMKKPAIGRFVELMPQLAAAKAYSHQGQITNFKIKLEQLTKPSLSKDVETNLKNLERTLEEIDKADMAFNYLESLKNDRGIYPRDAPQKFTAYTKALDEPLKYPNAFPVNMHYIDDEDKEFILKEVNNKKKWESYRG